MPSYNIEHTFIVKCVFTVHDAPSVADAVAMVDPEIPKAFWPEKTSVFPTDISTHHIKYEVQIVAPKPPET